MNKRRALTLAEAAISMVIVAGALVAALNAVSGAQQVRMTTIQRQRGVLLAQDLMAEIQQQHYEDPDLGPGSFGLGGDEVGDGSRALWEDVDDYDGWTASPPQEKDGTPLDRFADWSRSVSVSWVDADDLSQSSPSDTGVKQIVVTITCDDALIAEVTALRTNVLSYERASQ